MVSSVKNWGYLVKRCRKVLVVELHVVVDGDSVLLGLDSSGLNQLGFDLGDVYLPGHGEDVESGPFLVAEDHEDPHEEDDDEGVEENLLAHHGLLVVVVDVSPSWCPLVE